MNVKLLNFTPLEIADIAICKCYGNEPHSDKEKFISQDKIDRINELSKLGYTKTAIAKEIGISRLTVASYLKLEII